MSMPKAAVGGLGAGDRLEHQIHRRALRDRLQRVGHVRQHAGLRRDRVARNQLIEQVQQAHQIAHAVGCRVDADHRVARAVHQAVERRCQDARRAVARMIRLQPHCQVPRQAERVAKARDDAALARHRHQVLVAHQLAHRSHHLGREAGGECAQHVGARCVGQQPVAKRAHREMRHRREGRSVVRVDDQASHGISFIRHQRLLQQRRQRQIGQRCARRHALGGAARGNARELIARALGRGLGHQVAQVGEQIALRADGGGIAHAQDYTARACARSAKVLQCASRTPPGDGP